MPECHLYHNDGRYAGTVQYSRRLPGNATTRPLPPRPWIKTWPRLVDGEWTLEEDHRERSAALYGADAQEATPFWLPGDAPHEPRRMLDPGPLPEGAMLVAPPPDLAQAKAEKIAEIDQAWAGAMAQSLALPTAHPTALDLAVACAIRASADPEGFAQTEARLRERREDLEMEVACAGSAEAVAAISVGYEA